MIHISTFSGIGGFEIAAEWMGWDNMASCEINPFSRKVLEYYWPDSYHHDDIHTLTYKLLNEELRKRFGSQWRSDDIVLSGGFPCQPYSHAGKRQGKEDDRHLWPEMLRFIRKLRPTWVVGENVRGLVTWNEGLVFEEVQTDLEAEGYEVQPFLLPSAGVGAPHRRDRIWFVAYSKHNRDSQRPRKIQEKGGRERMGHKHEIHQPGESDKVWGNNSNSSGNGLQGWGHSGELRKEGTIRNQRFKNMGSVPGEDWENFPTQSPVCSRDDGFPGELAGMSFSKWRSESIKALGNAVVPQVVYPIFKAIDEWSYQHFYQQI